MINYGGRPSARMLNYYGFIDSEKSAEGLRLHLRLSPSDPLLKSKQELLDIHDLDILSCTFYPNYGDYKGQDDRFLSYLRLVVYQGDVQLLLPVPLSIHSCCGSI